MAFPHTQKSISDENKVKIYGAELTMREICEDIDRLEAKMRKLEMIVDSICMKASLSNCLLVIRKVNEENIDKLHQIIE